MDGTDYIVGNPRLFTEASVSFAMGAAGSGIALEAADVTLMQVAVTANGLHLIGQGGKRAAA